MLVILKCDIHVAWNVTHRPFTDCGPLWEEFEVPAGSVPSPLQEVSWYHTGSVPSLLQKVPWYHTEIVLSPLQDVISGTIQEVSPVPSPL